MHSPVRVGYDTTAYVVMEVQLGRETSKEEIVTPPSCLIIQVQRELKNMADAATPRAYSSVVGTADQSVPTLDLHTE